MKIKLQGIGLIKDSEIELNGLTVITGDNNSGKTTVGKTVYSLVDAVSNLSEKAKIDKNTYTIKKLHEVRDGLLFFSPIFRYDNDNTDTVSNGRYLARLLSFPIVFLKRNKTDIISFAHNLYEEIKAFQEAGLDMFDDEDEDKSQIIKVFKKRFRRTDDQEPDIEDFIDAATEYSLEILNDLFKNLEGDPQLIDYAKENIYQTLKTEFDGQIQPINADFLESKIVMEELNNIYFSFNIKENKIVNNGKPIFFESPIKNAFFIDNPFVLDSVSDFNSFNSNVSSNNDDHIINENRILRHEAKLKYFLKSENYNIFETNIIEKRYENINRKINEVLSGDFEFSDNGDYYISNGKKLRYSNLATGSKLFSILKLLVNKGALDDSTLLILDEPEAHLHPAWQNKFAEIIVMLVKELNVKILLTSHSPNFVLAIDAFMRKYEIIEKSNFYQTRFIDNGLVEYVNVDDDMGMIYSDFVKYLTEVKMLRNQYLHGLGENDD